MKVLRKHSDGHLSAGALWPAGGPVIRTVAPGAPATTWGVESVLLRDD